MSRLTCSLFAVALLAFTGCGGAPAPAPAPTTTTEEHAHEHPDHGPHDGDLVELGNEEYHAEIVHEAEGKLSVYILDSSAKNLVPIDATEITLNIVHDGSPEQHALAAAPTETDPAGKSSKFVSADAHAGEDLDLEGAQAKLAVTINGTAYQGAVAHNHAGHEHSDHKH